MKDISQKRHLAKAITWRVIASFTTFVIAYFFFREDPLATEKAGAVAITESIIKMGLCIIINIKNVKVEKTPEQIFREIRKKVLKDLKEKNRMQQKINSKLT